MSVAVRNEEKERKAREFNKAFEEQNKQKNNIVKQKILNPQSGRHVTFGGKTHKSLIKKGILPIEAIPANPENPIKRTMFKDEKIRRDKIKNELKTKKIHKSNVNLQRAENLVKARAAKKGNIKTAAEITKEADKRHITTKRVENLVKARAARAAKKGNIKTAAEITKEAEKRHITAKKQRKSVNKEKFAQNLVKARAAKIAKQKKREEYPYTKKEREDRIQMPLDLTKVKQNKRKKIAEDIQKYNDILALTQSLA